MMAGLGDPNWKVRLAAMEEVKSRLEAAGSAIPGDAFPNRLHNKHTRVFARD